MQIEAEIAVGFLAGGLARRMNGQDKALLEIGGQTILSRQLAVTAQHRVRILNINTNPERFRAFGLPVVADIIAGYPGPLAGILTCLDYLAENHPDIELMLSCATDAPFLPVDLAQRLAAGRKSAGAELAQARSFGRRHPVFGLWPTSIRDTLRHAICESHIRKIDDFTALFSMAVIDFDGQPDPFMNINKPQDLTQAEAICPS